MTPQQLQNNRTRIGQRITKIRATQQLSQIELAAKAGIQQATLSRVEKGSFSVGIDVLSKIATALACDIELLPK